AGAYSLAVGPGIADWYGNSMNQNRNLVSGEPGDAFQETIRLTAAGATDLLNVSGIPSNAVVGVAQTFTVQALSPAGGVDSSYLGTITFSSSDGQAVLPANYKFTAADAGTHTFTVTFKTSGLQFITATDTSNGGILGSQENIFAKPGAASSLKL